MAAMTDFLEDALLNEVFRNVDYTPPATVYVALFTDATGDDGSGTEVSGGSYARIAGTFGAPSPSGTIKNSGDITFPVATANWGVVTHVAIFDSAIGGNMLVHGVLASSKNVQNGDVFKFSTGNLQLDFA